MSVVVAATWVTAAAWPAVRVPVCSAVTNRYPAIPATVTFVRRRLP